jgi:glycosyltransferase involved in cell wall biosynthesis
MKIGHLSYYDGHVPLLIHSNLKKNKVDSRLFVIKKSSEHSETFNFSSNLIINFIKEKLSSFIKIFFKSRYMTSSAAIFTSGWKNYFNNSNVDLVNLFWVNRETISISEIGEIKKPIVWTLCDMWAFCGGENFALNKRYINGYSKNNKPSYELGFDFNKWLWLRKKKNWNNTNINIIAPNKWMANCAKKSKLMKKFNIKVIPYPVDTNFWKPLNKNLCKNNFKLNNNTKYLLLIISYAEFDWKGGDLFLDSLNFLQDMNDKFEIILVGNPSVGYKKLLNTYNFRVIDFGLVSNQKELRKIYNISELIVIPSRIDNLPLKGLEASSCGVPIVCFDIGGMTDLVIHKKNGWLAKSFETKDLACGIREILTNKHVHLQMSKFSRKNVIKKFKNQNVISQYIDFYKEILNKQSQKKFIFNFK